MQFTETVGNGGNVKAGLETSAGLYMEGCHEGKDKELQVRRGSRGPMQTERQCVLRGREKAAFLAGHFSGQRKGAGFQASKRGRRCYNNQD